MLEKSEEGASSVQKVETEFASGDRVGGFLAFFLVAFILSGFGALGTFFLALASLVAGTSGTGTAVAIELLIGSIFLTIAAFTAAVLIGLRKKLAKLVSLITLALDLLLTAVVAFTAMTTQITSYSYNSYYYDQPTTSGLPGYAIILLLGLIIFALVRSGLSATYFLVSARVKATLTK